MTKANSNTDLVKWEPRFSAEALAHMDQIREQVEPQIELMRRVRKVLKMTQKQVAEALGVTQSNVSKIETTGDPTLSVLVRMAESKGKRLRLILESKEGKEEAHFDLVA